MHQENQNSELNKVLATLSMEQIRYVIARQETLTDKAAAEMLNVQPNTVKTWKRNGARLDDACRLMAMDGVITALHLSRRVLARAMAVKVSGLESDSEKMRQAVATEIIEREMGKAGMSLDLTSKGDKITMPTFTEIIVKIPEGGD